MHQQYHHRQVEGRTLIWNVNKLVELSKDFPVIRVALKDIKELDETYWFVPGSIVTTRAILNHMKQVNEASLDYPIMLCSEGRIIDGMHRVVKASLLGHTHIQAVQFNEPLAPDYINVDLDSLPYDD